eukprot:GFUD01016734.1.p1 GENE.GFUD01016734.1~~GFUD01016734.1.p1  ORF type:complete len:354 (-),score=90.17 GFUD01016734.1:152-1213(-)
MGSEKFCLRWNDFETNVSVAFKELREEKDFFDVTLACDDSQIQAHKVILSACSPFFRNVLRRNPHQHPLLYLKGVKYQDLLSVLNFMYNGEVNVAQEELNTFLSVAEDLRVKGLTQNNSGTPKKNPPTQENARQITRPREPPEREPLAPPPQPKRPRPTPVPTHQVANPVKSYQSQYDDDIQEVVPVKSEPREPPPPTSQIETHTEFSNHGQEMIQEHAMVDNVDHTAVALDQSYAEDESYGYEEYGESYENSAMMNSGVGTAIAGTDGNKGYNFQDPSDLLQFIRKDDLDQKYYCTICGKFGHKLSSCTRNHVESQHFPNYFTYSCDLCEMTFGTKTTLNLHRSRKHNPKHR